MSDKMPHESVADLLFPPPEGETPENPPRADNPEVDNQDSTDGPEMVAPPEIPEEDQAEGEQPEAEPAEMPDTLEALATKAGLKVKDLYNVKIPMPAGEEPVTLGQFKDRLKDLTRADTIAAEAEDSKATLQAERLQFQQELGIVTQALQSGGKLSDDALRAAAENMQKYQAQQRQIAESIAPELAKPEIADGMAKVMERYGITRPVFDQIHDAPFRLAMHRLYTLESRLESAKAKEVKARQSKPKSVDKPTKAQRRQQTVEAVRRGRVAPESAVANLIFGD